MLYYRRFGNANNMRVALVHDYLNQFGGAERVLEALHELYPDAPVYTSIFDARAMPPAYRGWDIRVSWMQGLPAWRRLFRFYFALYPSAFESFDLTEYDLIISSSSAYAKGIIPSPGARHICYCHTPMRFAWRTDDYTAREHFGRNRRAILHIALTFLRMWDVASSHRVDHFVANSRTVAARIRRFYGREATIVPPPVTLLPFAPQTPGDFYVAGGRLVPYKRLDLAIQAFNVLKLPLKVFGEGRDWATLESLAGPNIEFLGPVDEATKRDLFARCRAFIFPGEEDFGITPLEVMACGRPVIAYGAGGALDTVIEGVTGRFFRSADAGALAAAISASHADTYDTHAIRAHAEGFGREVFLRRMRALIAAEIQQVTH